MLYSNLRYNYMKEIVNLPSSIPIFPLSNFIIFPDTMVPLNIFEPRYIQMIDDCMKSDRIIGMIQPKNNINKVPELRNFVYIIFRLDHSYNSVAFHTIINHLNISWFKNI